MEDWEKEFDEEMAKRHKSGTFLEFEVLSERMSVAFASWPDYHMGDNPSILTILQQVGYENPVATELGFFRIFRGPGRKTNQTKLALNSGYLFVYSDGKLSQQKLNKIKYHLGIDLKEKYNIDDWSL